LSDINGGRRAPVSGAAMEKWQTRTAMQPSAQPNQKANKDLRERMQENVIHHVG